jgi:hypothetical protein
VRTGQWRTALAVDEQHCWHSYSLYGRLIDFLCASVSAAMQPPHRAHRTAHQQRGSAAASFAEPVPPNVNKPAVLPVLQLHWPLPDRSLTHRIETSKRVVISPVPSSGLCASSAFLHRSCPRWVPVVLLSAMPTIPPGLRMGRGPWSLDPMEQPSLSPQPSHQAAERRQTTSMRMRQ